MCGRVGCVLCSACGVVCERTCRRACAAGAAGAARCPLPPLQLTPATRLLFSPRLPLPWRSWEDIVEVATEEAKEEEGGLPAEHEPDIFELEGEAAFYVFFSCGRGAL